jgi:type VI secretion system secreted protein VgrG
MPYSQEGRIAKVSSSLGDDVLLLRRLSGREAIGEIFRFDLELASEDDRIDLRAVIGSSLTVAIECEGSEPRYIDGIVSAFSQGPTDERFTIYHAEIVAWPWLMTQRSDCRIFQEKSTVEIIAEVFSGAGMTDFEMRVQGTYAPRGYCVQYRETDYAFVRRLMEEDGLHFYFLHEAKRHTLVVCDAAVGNAPNPQAQAVCARAEAAQRVGNVWGFAHGRMLRTGSVALTDYDFERPAADLAVASRAAEPIGGNTALEVYDYPGEYSAIGAGESQVRLRMEALEAASVRAAGRTDCAHFTPGTYFSLVGHPRPDWSCAYLLTEVRHRVEQSLRGEEPVPSTYENEITCIPHAIPWRMPRTTPRPIVHGVQTAVVVGPAGEEIYVDAHGRVKVHFHWDRLGRRDENSSCWVRVSQLWAGQAFGGVALPRIGQEVIIEFIEGDPDRPIITGRVYNGKQTPPYPLPAGKTLSGIKSRSSPGGNGYNEISLDDAAGAERITIHAQMDMDTVVEHDRRSTVHNVRTTVIDVDDSEAVGNDQTLSVGAAQTLSVGASRTIDIGANDTLSVGGSRQISVASDVTVSAGGTLTLSAGGSTLEISAAGITLTSAAPITVMGAVIHLN